MKKPRNTAGEDCRNRTELGPKALEVLRNTIKPFREMEEKALRAAESRRVNLAENGR